MKIERERTYGIEGDGKRFGYGSEDLQSRLWRHTILSNNQFQFHTLFLYSIQRREEGFTEKTGAYQYDLARRLVLRRDRYSGSESSCDHAGLGLKAVKSLSGFQKKMNICYSLHAVCWFFYNVSSDFFNICNIQSSTIKCSTGLIRGFFRDYHYDVTAYPPILLYYVYTLHDCC